MKEYLLKSRIYEKYMEQVFSKRPLIPRSETLKIDYLRRKKMISNWWLNGAIVTIYLPCVAKEQPYFQTE